MHLTVTHDRHYDWQIVKKDELAEGDVFQAAAKEDEVLRRTTVDEPDNFTICEVPQSLIDTFVTTRREVGKPISYPQAFAYYLQEIGLQHHVDLSWVKGVEVHDEPWWEGGDKDRLAAFLSESLTVPTMAPGETLVVDGETQEEVPPVEENVVAMPSTQENVTHE